MRLSSQGFGLGQLARLGGGASGQTVAADGSELRECCILRFCERLRHVIEISVDHSSFAPVL